MRRWRAPQQANQRGAALLAAMLLVSLVATLAASAVWQQWRATEAEAGERARQQAQWVLTGALDWARLILREDNRAGGADHLAEPWAVPLAESRLSSFLAADRNATADSETYDAFLSGEIADAQARLNATNLVERNGQPSEPDIRAWLRLYELLGLPTPEVRRLAENLRFARDTSPDNRSAGQAPLRPQRVADLRWLGVSDASLARLAPFIVLLPERTPVNLNTAPPEVIFASLDGIDLGDARRLVAERERQHFRTLPEVARALPGATIELNEGRHSVATRYFEVRGRLRLDDLVIEERSLVLRDGLTVVTVWREREVPRLPVSAALASAPSGPAPAR